MKQKIINLKQQIEDNYQALQSEYGNKCELATSLLEVLNLLLSIDAPDEKIQMHLDKIANAIEIMEEKLQKLKMKPYLK